MSDDQIARILAALERLETGQAQLATDVTTLRTDVTTLRTDVTTLRTEVMARIDRLQNTVTTIRDDITVNMGRADQAHRAADNVRDELRALNDVVSGVMRQVQRLQSDVRELRGEP